MGFDAIRRLSRGPVQREDRLVEPCAIRNQWGQRFNRVMINPSIPTGHGKWICRLVIFFPFVLMIGILPLASAAQVSANPKLDTGAPIHKLQIVGEELIKAVLEKDIEAILRYDRKDLIDWDRKELQDASSSLYCYLFDTSCITWQGRSVYEILRSARRPVAFAQTLKNGKKGPLHAIIFFYDGSQISRRSLTSKRFLCAKAMKEIVSWIFRYVDNHWEAVNAPFDSETDVLCSPE